MNPLFLTDFYKIGHVKQYPVGTTRVYSNYTPRSSRVAGQKGMIFFGLQYYMIKYLWGYWDKYFFQVPLNKILDEYKEVISATLGDKNPKTDHIEALHELGYLPLKIYALPEGTECPLGCPALVIYNTVDHAYWLPNFLETSLSNVIWRACTSATTAKRFRNVFIKWAKASGEEDLGPVDWMGHDFSYRGMAGLEDAMLSGMAHLLSFNGTDTIPAVIGAHDYYNSAYSCGGSVNATEHAVMCAGTKDNEQETFRRLMQDVYPTGILSIVSDTWDLWKVLTKYVPELRSLIFDRDGKIVIRPDSGKPTNILCGDLDRAEDNGEEYGRAVHPAYEGVLRLLAEAMGLDTNRKGLPLINKMAAIYGDGISVDVAEETLRRTVTELKMSPYNLVFGIGSYTYCFVTRDTYGQAMKATAVVINGKLINIFKKPITDDGGKTSHLGIPTVYRTEESTEEHPNYFVVQESKPEDLDNCAFLKVFEDGHIPNMHSFADIRKRVRS